ncbi:Endopolyphosphatase [Dimargaris verticillata]|uniref:Endopolyphosphatase n=1 Tax=Dimargaris verticillata TaxID=2761393 RepID=A0A9W8B5Y4_9FUNG|nr:Endopolyphosphatase [Dimargaris verticillata]
MSTKSEYYMASMASRTSASNRCRQRRSWARAVAVALGLAVAALWVWWSLTLRLDRRFNDQSTSMLSSWWQSWWQSPWKALSRPRPKGQFLHITDIHVDANYQAGATIDSYCHRPPKKSQRSKEISLAGHFGSPGTDCDSPVRLVDITFRWLSRYITKDIDFIVFTGDSSRHERDDRLPRKVDELILLNRYIASQFMSLVDPAITPVIHVIGNNDVEPHNILEPGPNPMLLGLYEAWKDFIPQDQHQLFLTMGYYRYILPSDSRLSVLALNTQWFYKSNDAVGACRKSHHPGAQQLVWMAHHLDKARARGHHVYIAGHVAPEQNDYFSSCYKRYAQLVTEYADVIQGQFFGHNNKDHFYFLAEDSDSRRTRQYPTATADNDRVDSQRSLAFDSHATSSSSELSVARSRQSLMKELVRHYKEVWRARNTTQFSVINVAPSIIPTYNPAFRVYHYQQAEGLSSPLFPRLARSTTVNGQPTLVVPSTAKQRSLGTLLDYDQYWLNLTAANEDFGEIHDIFYQPPFEQMYSAREQYQMPDLTLSSWMDLANRIVHNKTVRHQFAQFLFVLADG